MDDLVDGYIDGLRDMRTELPASFGNRSDVYLHAWLNGRDDRLSKPRGSAAQLRAALAKIRTNETSVIEDQ